MTSPTSATSSAHGAAREPGRCAVRRGFTLIEMLVVLSILGILMGFSIGAFRRSIPRRDIARNAVLDALRQARLFATAENAPATVRLEAATEERDPLVCALGRKTVAGWHLEGTDLDGWPLPARGLGVEEEPVGVIGKAVRLSELQPSWLDFGTGPAFDSPDGFALEAFVKVLDTRNQLLFTKGKGLVVRADSDGAVSVQVRVQVKDPQGELKEAYQSVSSERPLLVAGRFVKVAATFDGVQLRLLADDTLAAELALSVRAPFLPDRGASLLLGAVDEPAGLVVDEVKWGIFAGDTQELRDMQLGPDGVRMVRFGADGALDPRFHQTAAALCLLTPNGDPDKQPLETWIRVGLLGDVQ